MDWGGDENGLGGTREEIQMVWGGNTTSGEEIQLLGRKYNFWGGNTTSGEEIQMVWGGNTNGLGRKYKWCGEEIQMVWGGDRSGLIHCMNQLAIKLHFVRC